MICCFFFKIYSLLIENEGYSHEEYKKFEDYIREETFFLIWKNNFLMIRII